VLVQRHLAGAPQDLSGAAVDLAGLPPFATRVYRALRRVGPGQTVSYGELARRAGSPRAARAVGQAMARNPLALIVPCHRVLGSQGEPGGFSAAGGTKTKARLLRIEGVTLAPSRASGSAVAARASGSVGATRPRLGRRPRAALSRV
jgi:methylated-DNA-[protein]-cysteine S-methyltransferase